VNWKQKYRREEIAYADGQQAITRCGRGGCRWTYRGLIRDGKAAFRSHVELKHGRTAA